MSVYQVKHPPPKRAASRSGAARPPSVSKRHWSWYQSLMVKSRGHRHSRRTTGTTQKPRSTTRTCHVPLPKRQPRAAACAVRAEIGMGRRQGRHPLMPTSRYPHRATNVPLCAVDSKDIGSTGFAAVRSDMTPEPAGTATFIASPASPVPPTPLNPVRGTAPTDAWGCRSVVSQSVPTVRFDRSVAAQAPHPEHVVHRHRHPARLPPRRELLREQTDRAGRLPPRDPRHRKPLAEPGPITALLPPRNPVRFSTETPAAPRRSTECALVRWICQAHKAVSYTHLRAHETDSY